MDTYTKGILTVIAVCLVSITFQLSNTNPISNAEAEYQRRDYNMFNGHLQAITNELRGIKNTIRNK